MYFLSQLSRISLAKRMLALQIGIILIVFSLFLFHYLKDRATDPVFANNYYPALAEYIIGSMILSLCSALMVEAIEKSNKNEP